VPAPEPRHPSTVERELAEVRRQIALRAGTGLRSGSQDERTYVRQGLLAAVLLPVAALPLLLAVLAAVDGDPVLAVLLLLLSLPAWWFLLRAARRALAAYGGSDLDALRARERRLVDEAAASWRSAGPASFGERRPLAPDRQPSGYAQLLQARFRLGPPPAEALRALPPDAPAWRTLWYRYLGLSVVVPLAAGLGLVAARFVYG
jgi:hypothetical protein